jgi:hypothetical protein
MGAQSDKKVWLETASFWQLLRYFGRFALIIFSISWFSSWIATRFFALDFMLLNYHLINWWLFIAEGTVLAGAFYLRHWSQATEKKKQREKARAELSQLLEASQGGEHKK